MKPRRLVIPSDKHADAAEAWLKEWAPGFSTGQWAALAELLAALDAELLA